MGDAPAVGELVERLRRPVGHKGTNSEDGCDTYDELRLEAADEIARLRRLVAKTSFLETLNEFRAPAPAAASPIELAESLLFYVDFTEDEEFKAVLKEAAATVTSFAARISELEAGLKKLNLAIQHCKQNALILDLNAAKQLIDRLLTGKE